MITLDLIYTNINTEKAHKLAVVNCYAFYVVKSATKSQIKHALESYFKVKILTVRTVSMPKKFKSFKGTRGFESSYKKTYVTLAPSFSIKFDSFNISENV